MKNWDTLEPDVTLLLQKHYTKGREGRKVNKIVLHHNAGNLSVQGCWNVWQTRQASAHYQVQSDGLIGQLVYDSDTAWHCGDWVANTESIGIEHANNDSSNWTISEQCLDAGAHLVAALCVRFGLGAPSWGVNVFPHSAFKSTDCPGEIAGAQRKNYMMRARDYYAQMTGQTTPAPEPAPAVPVKSIDELADEVIAGLHGNGQARRDSLGANYDAVQARDVIAGKYGNGQARKDALGSLYAQVQARVNQLL